MPDYANRHNHETMVTSVTAWPMRCSMLGRANDRHGSMHFWFCIAFHFRLFRINYISLSYTTLSQRLALRPALPLVHVAVVSGGSEAVQSPPPASSLLVRTVEASG